MSDQVKNKNHDSQALKTVAPPSVTDTSTSAAEVEGTQPLTSELLASYQDSHYRLLLLLSLVLAFLLACFPISDPEIFFSFEVGKLVSSGDFPWGTDPFGFAAGDHAPWAHTGWLGDLAIYGLYLAGGGPLLVLVRALLLVFLFWLLIQTGEQKTPQLGTVLVVLLGIVTISHRLYFRTEFFSFILLGITFWALAYKPAANCWFNRLHQLTAGRCYWLLPLVFLLWVNLDSWFFLGLGVVGLWCSECWMKSKEAQVGQVRALTITTLLCVVACFVSPFHVKAFTQIPALLVTPTAAELDTRFIEQKQQNPNFRMTEQQRLFASPLSREFFKVQRSDSIAGLSGQAPFLPLCYPLGFSLSEWAYYLLLVIVMIPRIVARLRSLLLRNSGTAKVTLIALAFALLSIWQSRFIGFFAVGGVAMAILKFQSQPRKLPSLNRLTILGGQLLCLGIGLAIQIMSILHLIPTPDSAPSSFGHVHPRGTFGFSFRSDPSIQAACEEINHWQTMNLVAGKPFHVDWLDVVAYDVWFNPGSRHFFDSRLAVHSAGTTRDFFAAREALLGVIVDPIKPDGSNLNKVYERQTVWQSIFKTYDISYLVLKRRGQQQGELVRALLLERDKERNPLWKPLRLHNGQVYALAWIGSPQWNQMKQLVFDPGETTFRQQRRVSDAKSRIFGKESLSKFLLADPPRRPAALDEADWYLFQTPAEYYSPGQNLESLANKLDRYGGHQMLMTFSNIGARLATPINQLPMLPLWLSKRQSSVSSLYLSLEAARRAFANLPPDAPPLYRYEACLSYLQASTAIIEYENVFTPAALPFRDPQRLFLLRLTANAALEARQSTAISTNLQLAHSYISTGALDAAWDHYLQVKSFIEQLQPDQVETNIKKLNLSCKQEFGFSPDDLQNELKRRMDAWQKQVVQSGWVPQENEASQNVLNRTKLALQIGLPRKAMDELLAAGVKSVEASQLACQIYSMLGQFDLVWQEFVQKSPELRASLQPMQLHSLGALGEWCLGHPELAAQHRLALSRLINKNSLQSALYGGQFVLLGTGTKGSSNVFEGFSLLQDSMKLSFEIADQKIAAGLLHLEAGQPQQAAALFHEAIRNIEPSSSWRPLLDRYYLQITGEVLK